LVSRLLQVASLRTEAIEFLGANPLGMSRAWYRAARVGLADPELASRARRLLEMAGLGMAWEAAA
jgi:hypothetical protein